MGFLDFLEDLKVEKPQCRLDAAVQALEKYYTSTGNENTTGTYDDSSMIPQLEGVIMAKKKRKAAADAKDLTIETQRQIRELILGGTEGAYFTKDILEKAKNDLSQVDAEKLISTICVKFESDCVPDSPINATVLQDNNIGVLLQTSLKRSPKPAGSSAAAAGGAVPSVAETVAPLGNVGSEDPHRLTNPCLSAILVNDHRLSPNNRRTSAASIFLNSIPTIEMSQCSPFVRLSFITESDNFFDGLNQMSLIGFLGDKSSNSNITFKNFTEGGYPDPLSTPKDMSFQEDTDITVNIPIPVGIPINGNISDVGVVERKVASAGLELFAAPQTMTPLGNSSINEAIINQTVPLATLQGLSIDIAGLGQSVLANKTAAIEIMLHDRSRLPVLAPIIAANSYGATYVMIEFGWSHPQAMGSNSGNVYADFLNSLRDRSLYNIQVADTSMQTDGQVKISLRLASRGTSALNSLPVGTGVENVSARLIGPLMERLVAMLDRRSIEQSGQGTSNLDSSELRDIQSGFNARLADVKAPQALIPLDSYKSIMENFSFVSDDGSSSTADSIAVSEAFTNVRKILSESEAKQKSEGRFQTLSGEIEDKIEMISQIDIFNDGQPSPSAATADLDAKKVEAAQTAGVEEPAVATSAETNAGSKSAPTLGSVVMSFVGTTLKSTLKHDEVQILFYPFNRHAGSMSDINISEFKLEGWSSFITAFKEDNPQKSTRVFFDDLLDSACGTSNIEHSEYGLTTAYSNYNTSIKALDARPTEAAPGESEAAEIKSEYRETLRDDIEEILTDIYNKKPGPRLPKFVVPDVTMVVENHDVKVFEDKDNEKLDNTKNILRVHIFDAKAGLPYEADLLNTIIRGGAVANEILPEAAYTDPAPTTKGRGENASKAGESTQLATKIGEFLEDGSVRRTDGIVIGKASVVRYISNVPVRRIKDTIKSVFPSITLGSQFTNVHRISMSSSTSGDVAQVLLYRSVSDNETTSEKPSAVEDVFIIPSNATLTTAGFPLISYAQKFYIDMGTNTTADNFYYVVGIKHQIGPGTFQTTINTAYNGSGTIKATRTSLESVLNDQFPETDDGEVVTDGIDTSGYA